MFADSFVQEDGETKADEKGHGRKEINEAVRHVCEFSILLNYWQKRNEEKREQKNK